MGLFGSDDEKTDNSEMSKIKEVNRSAEQGLKELANKLVQEQAKDLQDETAQRRYLDILRREGGGL